MLILPTPESAAQGLAGTYTIGGSSPSFTTLNAAVSELKSKGVSGPVVFKIRTGVYEEQVSIPLITGVSITNTVTFESESGIARDVVIRQELPGTNTNFHTVQLRRAQHVNLRRITMENLGSNFACALHLAKASRFNRVEECIIRTDSSLSVYRAGFNGIIPIFVGDTVQGLISLANGDSAFFNTLISNNQIIGGAYGIYIAGINRGNRIEGNTIRKFSEMGVHFWGLRYNEFSGNLIDGDMGYGYSTTGMYTIDCDSLVLDNNRFINIRGTGMLLRGNRFVISNNRMNQFVAGSRIGLHLEGVGHKLYHNTIVMDAPGTTVAFIGFEAQITYAVYTIFAWEMEIYNNIISNPGGGYCTYYRGDLTSSRIDYNAYWFAGPTAKQDYYAATFTAWQNYSKKDSHSVFVDPGFTDAFLHTLNASLDGRGKALKEVKKDMDGEDRNPLRPDPGADEFILLDHDLGVLSITPQVMAQDSIQLGGTLINLGKQSLKDKTVTLVLELGTGEVREEAVLIKGLNTPYSTWEFKFKEFWKPVLTGSVAGRLYIKSPGLAGDANALNDTVKGSICVALRGTRIKVGTGSGAHVPTIKAALDSLKNSGCGLVGNIVLELQTGIYPERMHIKALNFLDSNSTLTITSQTGKAKDVVITGAENGVAYSAPIIKLDGTKGLILKHLTLRNMNPGRATGIQCYNGASRILIDSCVIELSPVDTSPLPRVPVLLADSLTGTGTTFSQVQVSGSRIIGGTIGVHALGVSTSVAKDLVLKENTLSGTSFAGILVQRLRDVTLVYNLIAMDSVDETNRGLITEGVSGLYEVSGNQITGAGYAGIHVQDVLPQPEGLLVNNAVGGKFLANPYSMGMAVAGSKDLLVAHNSVWMDKMGGGGSASFLLDNTSGVRLWNNSFSNTSGGHAYYITSPGGVLASDHNNLFTSGNKLAVWNGEHNGLAQLQAASGKDGKSISVDPQYLGATDLHTFSMDLNGKGLYLKEVSHDMDRHIRDVQNPDIGADEYTPGPDLAVSAILSPDGVPCPDSLPCLILNRTYTVKARFANQGNTILSGVKVSYKGGAASQVVEDLPGSVNPAQTQIHSFSQTWIPNTLGVQNLCVAHQLLGDVLPSNNILCKKYSVIPEPGDTGSTGTDAALGAWLNPVQDQTLKPGEVQEVKLRIKNAGTVLLQNTPIEIRINGLYWNSVTDTVELAPGVSHDFNTQLDWKSDSLGVFNLCAITQYAGDIKATNDTLCITVRVDSTSGLEARSSAHWILHPNPVEHSLWLTPLHAWEPVQEYIIEITEWGTGRSVLRSKWVQGYTVPVHHLSPGIYSLELLDPGSQPAFRERFIIP